MPSYSPWGPEILSRDLRVNRRDQFSVKDGSCYKKSDLTWIFFDPALEDVAKQICFDCPARIDCINLFFDEEHGVFGGYSETERAEIRKHRRHIAQTQKCNICLRTIGRCQCDATMGVSA